MPRPMSAIVGSLLMALSMSSYPVAAANSGAYEIEIRKSERLLLLRQGDTVLHQFPVSFGRGGQGDKHRHGDKKTPEGIYRIVKINDGSAFHTFLHLNYPNVKDAFFGLRDNLISRAEFDRIVDAINHDEIPPQHTPLGGAIGIHGIGAMNEEKLMIHTNFDWTQGCIALTNHEVSELRKYVTVGTKVVISE